MKPNRSQQANQPPTQCNDNQSLGGYTGRDGWNEFIKWNKSLNEPDMGSCHWCGVKLTIEDMTFKRQTLGPSMGPWLCIKCTTTPHGELMKTKIQ